MLSVFHCSTFGISLHETLVFRSLGFQFVFWHIGSVNGSDGLKETHIPSHTRTSLAWHLFVTDGLLTQNLTRRKCQWEAMSFVSMCFVKLFQTDCCILCHVRLPDLLNTVLSAASYNLYIVLGVNIGPLSIEVEFLRWVLLFQVSSITFDWKFWCSFRDFAFWVTDRPRKSREIKRKRY